MTTKSSSDTRKNRRCRTSHSRLVRQFRSKICIGSVACSDARQFLSSLPDSCANLVFLDPPFNLGKKYDPLLRNMDRLPEPEYARRINAVLLDCIRVLEPGGTLYLYHIPTWAMRFGVLLQQHLQFRHWIAVSMKNGFVRGRRLYPAHYALLMFTKGDPVHFHRPRIDAPRCRHCGKYVKDYGGYRHIIDANGINLSDVWEDLSPVRHARYKNRHANELPKKLFDRVMDMSAVSGRLYVDPFSGTGSGVLAAIRHGMTFAACDLTRANYALICRRISELRDTSTGET